MRRGNEVNESKEFLASSCGLPPLAFDAWLSILESEKWSCR